MLDAPACHKEEHVSVAKVIEIIGEGDTIEEAVSSAVKAASTSVRNVRGVWVQDIKGVVKGLRTTLRCLRRQPSTHQADCQR